MLCHVAVVMFFGWIADRAEVEQGAYQDAGHLSVGSERRPEPGSAAAGYCARV